MLGATGAGARGPDGAGFGDALAGVVAIALATRALEYMRLSPGTPLAGLPIDVAYIGSCTGGKTSDFLAFAHVVKGKSVKIDTFGVPATPEIVHDLQSARWGDKTVWQVLTEAGLLPGALVRNRDLQFHCEHIFLKAATTASPFTNKIPAEKLLRVPIAHGEGCYFADEETLAKIKANNQILWQYCDASGNLTDIQVTGTSAGKKSGYYCDDISW